MTKLRDHSPISIDEFMGLYMRGKALNTPLDHFQDCENVQFTASGDVETRDGIGISQDVAVPLSNVKRIYNFPTQIGNDLIVLTYDYVNDFGSIYHVVDSTTVYGPLLTLSKMTDFAFVPYAGRGYISPFSAQTNTVNPPAALTAIISAGAGIEVGLHKYAVTFITTAGETTPSDIVSVTTLAALANPTTVPTLTDIGLVAGNNLTPGATYHWRVTYIRNGLETNVGTASSGFVAPTNSHGIGLQLTTAIPTGVDSVNIYRTLANGSTYYREFANLNPTALNANNVPPSPTVIDVGITNDTDIVANPVAPSSNGTQEQQVSLTNIAVGGPTVTSRKVYRTVAAGSQLKLLTTLSNNTTTVYTDSTADASLGANVPTTNTALISALLVDKGLQGEFLYVYAGDGTAARKAAGDPLSGTLTIANGNSGYTDAGLHIFGFVDETLSGYLSAPGALGTFTTSAASSVSFGNVPTSGSPVITKRHLVASKAITGFNGDVTGYQLFFVPNATINNNTDTSLNNISFYDADLLDDASHLLENYSSIPAGAILSVYHNRLVVGATYTDISLLLVSAPGEFEAINQISGLIVVPLDGNPVTNAQELRDILYVFKRARTVSFTDNGDDPSTWPLVVIDNALGTSVHGIATVLDSGSSSVDYLIICTYQGVSLFNGRYVVLELSWKIEDFWQAFDRTLFDRIQVVNAPIKKQIYIVTPDRQMLVCNYSKGMDPKNVRWSPWTFLMKVNTVAIHEIDEIILGADLVTS